MEETTSPGSESLISADLLGSRLPYNREAEESILCALFLDEEYCRAQGAEEIHPDWFYVKAHSIVFGVMLGLIREDKPIDLVSVGDRLSKQGELDRVGGALMLANLSDRMPSAAHFPHHLELVREAWQKRRMVQAANCALEMGRNGSSAMEMRSALDQALLEFDQHSHALEVVSLEELMPRVRQQIQPCHERTEGGYEPTGIEELDEILGGGLYKSSLTVLAGRPSMGKSAIALKIARNVSRNKPVLLFSMEMSADELAKNLLALESGVNSYRIRRGNYKDGYAFQCVEEAADTLAPVPIYIADAGDMDLGAINAASRRMHYKHGVGLVVIDYLQLLAGDRNTKSREERVARLSRGCKVLAKSLDVPVLLISQLNREVDSKLRKDHRPRLSDLRESGSIEQDADSVLFVFRKGYYDQETRNQEAREGISKTELIVGKQRLGPIGTVLLRFLLRCGDFEPWRDDDEPEQTEPEDLRGAHIEKSAGKQYSQDDLPF